MASKRSRTEPSSVGLPGATGWFRIWCLSWSTTARSCSISEEKEAGLTTAGFFGEEAAKFSRDARPTLISGDSKGLILENH